VSELAPSLIAKYKEQQKTISVASAASVKKPKAQQPESASSTVCLPTQADPNTEPSNPFYQCPPYLSKKQIEYEYVFFFLVLVDFVEWLILVLQGEGLIGGDWDQQSSSFAL